MEDRRKRNPSSSCLNPLPLWERKFVSNVGNMGWGRFLLAKKSLYLYTDVLKWDDSVGEEAFHNAKSRFWAELNNLRPPKNSAPAGSDACTDAIDWNQDTTDPELYKDWDKISVDEEEDMGVTAGCIADNPVSQLDLPVVATGWIDDEEDDNGNFPSCLKSLMKPILVPSACVADEAGSRNYGNPKDRGCRNYSRKHRWSFTQESLRVNPLWVY